VVDGSLLSTAIWFNHQPIIATSPGLPADTAVNQGMAGGAPAGLGTYRTKDGRFISLILLNDPDHEWNDLAKCLGHPELSSDPRFADRAARANYRPEARALLEEIFGSLTLDELRVLLDKMTGVWAPFQTPAEIHNDPQVIANRFLQEVDYPGGALNLPTPPVLFDEEALPAKRAPDFAQHTDEVLREFGFNDGDLARHRAAGVIA
jgi:crotonobetainyl-CoA:carnitine CoA-transferase CaiB-like acyl-CoA transferase